MFISIAKRQSPPIRKSMRGVFNYLFPATDPPRRTYSTQNPILPPITEQKFHPKLVTVIRQLDAIAPRFLVKNGDIEILNQPCQFYDMLKAKILAAKSRVFLSSLYVGTAQSELIDCIDTALSNSQELQVYILLDSLRGTREAPDHPCSASLFMPLISKHGKHRIDVRMYHTPNLSGLTKYFAPKRLNETYGLQHMKLYGFDNEIILTGANLSHDYFTDRQDRYYLFKSPGLTDYYFKIQSIISSLSYQVLPSTQLKQGFRLTWPTSNNSCEPHLNFDRFISDASFVLDPVLKQHRLSSFEEFDDTNDHDTIVYPVSQFTPLFPKNIDNSTERPAISRLLSYLDSPSIKWWFTAGYFNMLPEYQDRLINGRSSGTVITASPKANSFYKSSGLSYYVPEAYLLFAKRFLSEVYRVGKSSLISVYEWQNGIVNTVGGWSYHAKGIWITVPEEENPSITVIGSSNYTKRAYSLDLESNAVIVTKDEKLKQKMKDEISNLMVHAHKLELSDFDPKPAGQAAPIRRSSSPHVDISENALQAVDTLATMDEDPPKGTERELDSKDDDRKISYAVHLAVKLLGGKL